MLQKRCRSCRSGLEDDLSSAVIEQNRVAFPHMEFHTVNVEEHDLPTGFDVVVSSEVIEHLQQLRARRPCPWRHVVDDERNRAPVLMMRHTGRFP